MTKQIVVVGNLKGGTGKSTVTINLAAGLAQRGVDVVMIDTDVGQATSARWADRRSHLCRDAPPVHCVMRTGHVVPTIRDAAKRYESVLVDVGGRDSGELRDALLVANTLVIPTLPTQADLEAVATFAQTVAKARSINDTLQVLVVFSKAPTHPGRTEVEEARAALTGIPIFAVAETVIRDRKAYDSASVAGLGVVEWKDRKAAAEIESLMEEIYGG